MPKKKKILQTSNFNSIAFRTDLFEQNKNKNWETTNVKTSKTSIKKYDEQGE